MKDLNISSSLTNISDKYIEEAREMPLEAHVGYIPPKKSFWQKLSGVVNSPVGVACVCAIVAFGVLSGIIFAGQNPPSPTPPAGIGGDTSSPQLEHDSNIHIDPDHTQSTDTNGENSPNQIPNQVIDKSFNFDFSFTIDEGGVFKRGETYNIQTSITNIGSDITYTGSSTEFFAEATLIRHSGQTYIPEDLVGYEISALFPISDDYVTKTIPTGYKSLRTGVFHIPDSVPVGQYDLKISYKNEYIIYENAVSIYDEERFAFAYEGIDPFPDGNVYNVGGSIQISASVTNLGDAFMVYEDHSDSFVPRVKFVCRATGYTIHATTSQSDDITTFEVAQGQVGKTFYFADIPEDADAGVYDLVLSYSNESRTFYQVVEIIRWKESEDTTPSETTPVPDFNPALIQNEEDALALAIAYMKNEKIKLPSSLDDESHWDVNIEYYSDIKTYHITFYYIWASIFTKYHWNVLVDSTTLTVDVDPLYEWDENAFFMRYTEDDVYAAVARLEFPVFPYNGSSAIHYEEIDGKLYVCKEFFSPEEGNSREEVLHEGNDTNIDPPQPLVPQRDNIISITVTSDLPNKEFSQFEGDKATAIVDYLLSLNLISDFKENLDASHGEPSHKIVISYEDGTSLTIYHFTNKFIRVVGSRWYKMEYEEAERFTSLLYELSMDTP